MTSTISSLPASAASPERAATAASSTSSPIASTSALTLDQVAIDAVNAAAAASAISLKPITGQAVKEDDEDAKLFASLVNGIQTGVTAATSLSSAQSYPGAAASLITPPLSSLEEAAGLGTQDYSASGARAPPDEPPLGPIKAYAKLEFPGFSYYIQTLDFTIGRRPAEFRSQTAEEQHITGASKLRGDVDVDLGPLKSISRFHVRIYYQEHPIPSQQSSWVALSASDPHSQPTPDDISMNMAESTTYGASHSASSTRAPSGNDEDPRYGGQQSHGRFVLQVLGRNGLCIDDVYVGKDAVVPLGKRTKLQIAERVFYFVLPPSQPPAPGVIGREASLGTSEDDSGDGEEDSEDERSSLESSEEEGSDARPSSGAHAAPAHKKLVLKKKAALQSAQSRGGKGTTPMNVDTTSEEQRQLAETIANRKRKRGEPLDEDDKKALKVGTPIGVEALESNRKRKKAKADENLLADESASSASFGAGGRGKGAGKAAVVSAALAAKAKADADAIVAAAAAAAAAAAPRSVADHDTGSNAAANGISTPLMLSTSAGTPLSAAPAASASPTAAASPPVSGTPSGKKPLPPAGAGVKPDKSNMDLIREAMAGSLSTSRGGKMALQEVYEYLTSTYEWFRNNSRANGRDWHSAIRHAIGNAKDMVRIARKSHEAGKGVFYAFATSDAAKADKLDQEAQAAREAANPATLPVSAPTIPATTAAANPTSSAVVATTMPQSSTVSPPTIATMTVTAPTATMSPSTVPPVLMPAPVPPTGLLPTKPVPASQVPTQAPTAISTPPAPRVPSSASPVPRPPPPSSSPASSMIAANGRVRIVVGKAPADALAQMALVPKAAITQNIEALFGGPPIVHHEGTLFLSPIVFGRMSAQEISDIGGKGAQQALATLQAQLVSYLQSKITGAGSPPPQPAPSASMATAGPSRPPLMSTGARPAIASAQRPTFARPAPLVNNLSRGRPPILNKPSPTPTQTDVTRPPSTTVTGPQAGSRPPTLSTAAVSRPPTTVLPSSGPQPVGRLPLNTGARPTAGQIVGRPPSTGRPGRPPLHPRPAVQPPSATIARPSGADIARPGSGTASAPAIARPGSGTASAPAIVGQARPTVGQTGAARPAPNSSATAVTSDLARPSPPAATSNGRPPLPRPMVGTASFTPTRPGPGRPPLNAHRPTATGHKSARPSAPAVNGARPGPGRPPLSARPRPAALPGQQVGRPPASVAQSLAASQNRPPVVPLSLSAQRPPIVTAARPGTASNPASGVVTAPASATSTPAASAEAEAAADAATSQADMAALLALLTSGKLDSGKLTPAQQQLLQRAGRLAAEQQKAQQQKAAAGATGGVASTPARAPTASPNSVPGSQSPTSAPSTAARPVGRPSSATVTGTPGRPPVRPPITGAGVGRVPTAGGPPAAVRPPIARPVAAVASSPRPPATRPPLSTAGAQARPADRSTSLTIASSPRPQPPTPAASKSDAQEK